MTSEQQREQIQLLQTEINLGAYDRQQRAFPIKASKLPNKQQNYQYKVTKNLPKESNLPQALYIYISNINQLKQLKLEPELARLLMRNNTQQGHIDSLPLISKLTLIKLQVSKVKG